MSKSKPEDHYFFRILSAVLTFLIIALVVYFDLLSAESGWVIMLLSWLAAAAISIFAVRGIARLGARIFSRKEQDEVKAEVEGN